ASPPPLTHGTETDGASVQFILTKCLAKVPADRYATADLLVQDIDLVLSGASVGPPASRARWRRSLQFSCACILVLFGTGYYVWPRHQGEARPPVTVFQLPTTQLAPGITLVRLPRGRFLMGTTNNAAIRGDDEAMHEVEF